MPDDLRLPRPEIARREASLSAWVRTKVLISSAFCASNLPMDDSMAFMGQMECGPLSIQQQLQNQASITIKKNRAILKSVLKQLYFVVNNISLRGSCEAISPVSSSQFAINPGSLQALLQFQRVGRRSIEGPFFCWTKKCTVSFSSKWFNCCCGKVDATKTNPGNQSHKHFQFVLQSHKHFQFVLLRERMQLTKNNYH